MYTTAIIQMISWPVLIIVSYQLIKLAVKKLENKIDNEEISE